MTFSLPVSGHAVAVKAFTGREEVLVLEAASLDLRLGLALLERLIKAGNGTVDPGTLTITDYETLLLAIHLASFGDHVTAVSRCADAKCASRIEVSFRIADYIRHNQPRTPKEVIPIENRVGWFDWSRSHMRYRLPTVHDVADLLGHKSAEQQLLRRCLDGVWPDANSRKRIERFMAMQAPTLSGDVMGTCPSCGSASRFYWDIEAFVLREIRDQAVFVYEDTHLLALHYHWPESQILDMPQGRRMQYAEMLRGAA